MHLTKNKKTIIISYNLEKICDKAKNTVGYELLSCIKYLHSGEPINPEVFFSEVSNIDEINILRSQIDAAIKFLSEAGDGVFITINISKKIIELLSKDECLLCNISKNNSSIIFEINERVTSDNLDDIKKISSHVEIWIDDFGKSKYREQLQLLPYVTGIKISHQLLHSLEALENGTAILNMIIGELKVNNLKIIVEGVENEEIYKLCSNIASDLFQGYYLGSLYLCEAK